jgi:hypothetical protein
MSVDGAWLGDPNPDDFVPDGAWSSANDEARRAREREPERFRLAGSKLIDTLTGAVYVREGAPTTPPAKKGIKRVEPQIDEGCL